MITLQEIADELGCSHQNVSHMEKKICNKIKIALQDNGFDVADLTLQSIESLGHTYFMQQWIRDYESQNIEHAHNELFR